MQIFVRRSEKDVYWIDFLLKKFSDGFYKFLKLFFVRILVGFSKFGPGLFFSDLVFGFIKNKIFKDFSSF